ncbi:hypothetical protein POPTR_019G023000v4 [Populus trichocarpa]|uniref:Leucine-rich repeat-containing N-terminal plant-type domain-containing protein n=1 Tax=Populus trichocarpa TaxID=3694 RepID=A0A2K1WMK9_POPTR|nr:hypothetical protein POPTR_019G023000v4 [Populus trichocarpa]
MAPTHLDSSFSALPTLASPSRPLVESVSSKNSKGRCKVATGDDDQIVRRSANYQTSMWDYDFVQSLTSKYNGEPYIARSEKLKANIRMMLANASKPLDQLELIDTLERLGLSYHYNTETVHDLYATALEFRLLRQRGYHVPQEVFNHFKDEQGNFRACIHDDLKGMINLYEPSYFLVEGENILEDARDFTTKNLENYVKKCNTTEYLSELVSHALELPLAWRMLRLEAHWFINLYETKTDMEPVLLELAKLDFNMVQAVYQEDLKDSSRWWKMTGLGEKLDFVRDRPMWIYTNAWISIATSLAIVHTYFYASNPTTEEASHFMEEYPDIIRWSSIILRLADDLGTSSDEIKRGDVSKSIQCYMHETQASEEEARDHIKKLISNAWKKLNASQFSNPHISQTIIGVAVNLPRTAQCIYQYGDGHAIEHLETKDRVMSLLIKPL